MIIPLHLVPDAGPAPLEFFDARQWQSGPQVTSAGFSLDPALLPGQTLDIGMPIAGPVDVRDLHVLQELMQGEGMSLQPTRMLYDRLYAFERLAAAHASGQAALQALAMRLFGDYQRAGEWIGLIH
ncbi:hypothetical protein PFX98_23185 [Paucibacter sediminis]|uniref:Uncharacterized protein n=1 Tax=Paucibacter sediminis TaxID=3019553 RepID=A0AA95NCU2_9BURK|nr:hypothetical protein [Paucibacter sp. S2-9]WIT11754.1 hypothetical protein PFX98_23185 [Paucibacter sp. S2-9]